MKTFALRLNENQNLKGELLSFCKQNNILAGIVLTCVGSLKSATLRMADENIVKTIEEKFEIVSLVGTLSKDNLHLHISLSDKDGAVIGGHLKDGCLIYTTAEIVIGELGNTIFTREFDEKTGFKELVVSQKN